MYQGRCLIEFHPGLPTKGAMGPLCGPFFVLQSGVNRTDARLIPARGNSDMSDEKSKAGDIAKNIWLAGVGAYGRAVEEAQDRLEKAMEPPKLFRELVKAGAALEEEARETTEAARHSVEERINRVRENFQNQRPARYEDLEKLQKKVDQLTRKVNKLSSTLAQLDLDNDSRRGKPKKQKPQQKKAKAAKVSRKKPAVKKTNTHKTTTRNRSA